MSSAADLPTATARAGPIRGWVPALRAFAEHRRALHRQAVLGHGALIDPLLAGRRAQLTRLRRLGWLRALSDATHRHLHQVLDSGRYGWVLPLAGADLAMLMELRVPFLADAAVLRHPIHAPAAEVLPELALLRRRAGAVRAILAASSLAEAGSPFRSEPGPDGALIMRGQDAATVEALAGLAHELGHCLYERARPVRCVRGQIASERFAQYLEERATDQYLRHRGSERERHAWWVYQRRVDAVNLYFFALERALLFGGEPAAALLSEPVTVLRESLFTLPGYQVVYARASLARLPITPTQPPPVRAYRKEDADDDDGAAGRRAAGRTPAR